MTAVLWCGMLLEYMMLNRNKLLLVLAAAVVAGAVMSCRSVCLYAGIGQRSDSELQANNPVKYMDPDGKASTETEVTLRIDGTLGKTNARDMAVAIYQYSKNPNEGALSNIATSAVGLLDSKPGIASALVSLVLASSNDEKNKINDFAFSIMNALSGYGELI